MYIFFTFLLSYVMYWKHFQFFFPSNVCYVLSYGFRQQTSPCIFFIIIIFFPQEGYFAPSPLVQPNKGIHKPRSLLNLLLCQWRGAQIQSYLSLTCRLAVQPVVNRNAEKSEVTKFYVSQVKFILFISSSSLLYAQLS